MLFRDPRHDEAGCRLVAPTDTAEPALRQAGLDNEPSTERWDENRLRLGLPDGSRDLVVDRTILLEAGFDELGGVNWQKGCYVGQELTARTKYRGLIKRRLVPVELTTPSTTLAAGDAVFAANKEVGELRSVGRRWALASLRLEVITKNTPLTAGDTELTIRRPEWMVLPEKPAP